MLTRKEQKKRGQTDAKKLSAPNRLAPVENKPNGNYNSNVKEEEYAFITNDVIAIEDQDTGLFIRALPWNPKTIQIISDVVRIAMNLLTGPLNVALFQGIIMLKMYQFLFVSIPTIIFQR